MSAFPHHRQINLKQITAFQEVELEFTDTINVFVGENGTGKTHLMKILYALQLAHSRNQRIASFLEGVFQTNNINDLIRIPIKKNALAFISVEYGNIPNIHKWEFSIYKNDESLIIPDYSAPPRMPRPVFIPAIDMMGHTRRFLTTYDEYRIDFDLTHRDIVSLLLGPEKRSSADSNLSPLINLLGDKLGGEVVEEGERFYLQTKEGRQAMPLVADGLRKIATLQQLMINGWLSPGATLFWDEPEINLNPELMDEVAKVLLELGRSGVQIFIATHSYVILKELEVQSRIEDRLRFFSFERSEEGTVTRFFNSYLDISPNLIDQQYASLYDRDIQKRMEG